MVRKWRRLIAAGAAVVLVAGCSTAASPAASSVASPSAAGASTATTAWKAAPGSKHTIAFFAAASQNGFNAAVYEGVKEAAAKAGATAEIFDGQFDAGLQLNQVEDAVASGRFDGFVIVPSDPGGIASTIESGCDRGFSDGDGAFPDRGRLHDA